MIIALCISIFVLICFELYFLMSKRCIRNKVFCAPCHRWVYYLLSFTWGLPMNIAGAVVALILLLTKHKPVRRGWNFSFEFDDLSWGLNLGIFMICPKNERYTYTHEHGHGIQNIYFGIFTLFIIALPSVIRFWHRSFLFKHGKQITTCYDDVWFEGSATESGKEFFKSLEDMK